MPAAVLPLLLTVSCTTVVETSAPRRVPPTEVREYAPWWDNPAARQVGRRGVCDTPSEVVRRPDAWLCRLEGEDPAVGDTLHDPCVAHPTAPAATCPDSPDLSYEVRLPAPLPTRSPPVAEAEPWMLRLTNGEVCTTRSVSGGTPHNDGVHRMECFSTDYDHPSGGVVRGGIDRTHDTWTVWLSRGPGSAVDHVAVAVAYR
ncbi:hypothetical protein FHS29_001692 [Saccharothrix tamanrassetensis]|uniref:Uncharacterized protein n=1 Tax=Saccharothrix tamanrassetensis TaxID=1051531 RepID=A0A841C9A6_9PSEU|nr:hypothetical protein [Saccharothrix tamanrassetensis]MBB5955122.1 hypothetical protein [Saccharothrix tamanrassetensis]